MTLRECRRDSEWPGDDDLVFPASNGAVMSPNHLRRRVLKPAAEEACGAWVGFHAFRHTCASMLLAEGRNAVQVQRWLDHRSPAFTLSVYVHLLDGDMGESLTLPASSKHSRTRLVRPGAGVGRAWGLTRGSMATFRPTAPPRAAPG